MIILSCVVPASRSVHSLVLFLFEILKKILLELVETVEKDAFSSRHGLNEFEKLKQQR